MASHPLSTRPSQSPRLEAHSPIAHAPLEQTGVAFGTLHGLHDWPPHEKRGSSLEAQTPLHDFRPTGQARPPSIGAGGGRAPSRPAAASLLSGLSAPESTGVPPSSAQTKRRVGAAPLHAAAAAPNDNAMKTLEKNFMDHATAVFGPRTYYARTAISSLTKGFARPKAAIFRASLDAPQIGCHGPRRWLPPATPSFRFSRSPPCS